MHRSNCRRCTEVVDVGQCLGLFHGFDRSAWIDGTPTERLSLLPAAQEHVLAQENGKDRLLGSVRELSQAFALAVPHEEALAIRDEAAFFQAVRAALAKRAPGQFTDPAGGTIPAVEADAPTQNVTGKTQVNLFPPHFGQT